MTVYIDLPRQGAWLRRFGVRSQHYDDTAETESLDLAGTSLLVPDAGRRIIAEDVVSRSGTAD